MNAERQERAYLNAVLEKVQSAIYSISDRISKQSKEIRDTKTYLQEHKRDMDRLDKNAVREVVSRIALMGEVSVDKLKRLQRLLDVPYFGRLDFRPQSTQSLSKVYVGVHTFKDDATGDILINDWRAPISSMFYDFEPGPAYYNTLNGRVEGDISLKRQFRIRGGQMEYMLDSDVTIQDDVLQRELHQASSSRMRNIVATIQREQNAIIRNENAHTLVIQGVAGSGKTSIALHRIAFLLYKFNNTISSDDILIISPNKVFSHYIANVLPELGEETVAESSMEDIANRLFDYQVAFQSFADQVAELLEKNDKKLVGRIRYKSSRDILRQLDSYVIHLENDAFNFTNLTVNDKPVPQWFIEEKFKAYHRMPLLKRFNPVVEEIVNNVRFYYKYEVMGKERNALHTAVRKMFPSTSVRALYRDFYKWIGREDMLRMRKGATYEYSDVYPLLYLKMKLEGFKPYTQVKHLVIDEMQDYSEVQYQVLSRLFACRKTILGDINQSVNPFSSSNTDTIKSVFPDATCMTMLKSYRSTFEIIEFTKRINPDVEVEPLLRYGETPAVHGFESEDEELDFIRRIVEAFEESRYNTLGIITKTQLQANALYNALSGSASMHLLDQVSISKGQGVVVTPAQLAKGLEFDMVLVPHCSASNYRNEMDRQMLYVACTRAMHVLNVTFSGTRSGFLDSRS